jgi:hypothetical protein
VGETGTLAGVLGVGVIAVNLAVVMFTGFFVWYFLRGTI